MKNEPNQILTSRRCSRRTTQTNELTMQLDNPYKDKAKSQQHMRHSSCCFSSTWVEYGHDETIDKAFSSSTSRSTTHSHQMALMMRNIDG
jgi:hypothetical protein